MSKANIDAVRSIRHIRRFAVIREHIYNLLILPHRTSFDPPTRKNLSWPLRACFIKYEKYEKTGPQKRPGSLAPS